MSKDTMSCLKAQCAHCKGFLMSVCLRAGCEQIVNRTKVAAFATFPLFTCFQVSQNCSSWLTQVARGPIWLSHTQTHIYQRWQAIALYTHTHTYTGTQTHIIVVIVVIIIAALRGKHLFFYLVDSCWQKDKHFPLSRTEPPPAPRHHSHRAGMICWLETGHQSLPSQSSAACDTEDEGRVWTGSKNNQQSRGRNWGSGVGRFLSALFIVGPTQFYKQCEEDSGGLYG